MTCYKLSRKIRKLFLKLRDHLMKWRCRHFPSVRAQIQDPSLDSMEFSFLNYSCYNEIKEEKAICDTYSLTSGNCYKFPSLSGHFYCREPSRNYLPCED